jgi:hypothetical protein
MTFGDTLIAFMGASQISRSPCKKLAWPVSYIVLPVLFEILNERCPLAIKNDHFIKQATGKMSWKDKIKMYYPLISVIIVDLIWIY